MKTDHIDRLVSIYTQTTPQTNMVDLINTYSNKITEYVSRDLKNGKSVAFILDALPQRNRAINVMTAYAIKNYGYENKE